MLDPEARRGLLDFHDPTLEVRYLAHRQHLMAPMLRLWAVFGTATVIAALAGREASTEFVALLFAQGARFLALQFCQSSSARFAGVLYLASFPLRAALLVTCQAHINSQFHLLPLLAVYDGILYPSLEQVRWGLFVLVESV